LLVLIDLEHGSSNLTALRLVDFNSQNSSSGHVSLGILGVEDHKGKKYICQKNKGSQRSFPSLVLPAAMSILKKDKRQKRNSVNFGRVTVFYFPRCQGFGTVPSDGDCTLGMAEKHGFAQEFTMSEFCEQQKIVRHEKMKDKLKEEKLEAIKVKVRIFSFAKLGVREGDASLPRKTEGLLYDVDLSSMDQKKTCVLQPYTTNERCALLESFGVNQVDKEEKWQLETIRLSREKCGCDCQEFCDPETCSCSLEGIKCQMDYTSFPCGCTKDGCGNIEGRIEFDEDRVHKHYLHTRMRLQLKQNQRNDDGILESELPFEDDLHPFAYPASYEEVDVSPMAVLFSTTLQTVSENSCSSNMTDSSASTNQNVDLEELFETNPDSQSDMDDNSLAQILHFCNSDEEENINCIDHCQDNLSPFHSTDFFSMDVENECATNPVEEISFDSSFGYLTNINECLDDNANQGPSSALEEISSEQGEEGASYSPSSFEEQGSKSYMDLSFSSDSFDFFQPCPDDYNLGPLYNSLREYENVDNFTDLPLQLPNIPALAQPEDQNNCFLESWIELPESISEAPAPFSDNQLLEDAINSSLEETMKL
uniref:Cysteine and serine rich nuclear protein 1 n=1 Tax=Naja naja TaxID=35670 RepID=A0A8C6XNP4_NAJNA